MSQVTVTSRVQPSIHFPNLAMLTFNVARQLYGLPVTDVVRIIEMVTITQLPDAPEIIQGIINLQGKTVPVMDLRYRFGLPRKAYGLHTPIILADMGSDERILGLIVDAVEDVIEVPTEDLEMTDTILPADLAGQMSTQAGHLAAVAKIDRQMILVFNVRVLLSPAEQIDLSRVLDSDDKLSSDDGRR
jgi:purine-binding chemotaxis protein CheW